MSVVRAAGGVPVRDGAGRARGARRPPPAYDDWTFPKGKCDPGETDEACAVREVEEETGLVCAPRGRAAVDVVPRTRRAARSACATGGCASSAGELRFDHEVDDARWVSARRGGGAPQLRPRPRGPARAGGLIGPGYALRARPGASVRGAGSIPPVNRPGSSGRRAFPPVTRTRADRRFAVQLPDRPNLEHLRKQAKSRRRERGTTPRRGAVRARSRVRLPELAAARPPRPGARPRGHRAASRRRRPGGPRDGARHRSVGRPTSPSTGSSRSSTCSAAPPGAAPTSASAPAFSSRPGPTPTRSRTRSRTASGTSTPCGAPSTATTRR